MIRNACKGCGCAFAECECAATLCPAEGGARAPTFPPDGIGPRPSAGPFNEDTNTSKRTKWDGQEDPVQLNLFGWSTSPPKQSPDSDD